jgi:hypothetical protein
MRSNVIAACLPVTILASAFSVSRADEATAKTPRARVTISKETTYITEPLRDDGYPDYIRYLDEKLKVGVTPENNAAVLILQTLGPREISTEDRDRFFKGLGIDPLPEKGDYYIRWFEYSGRYSAKDWPLVPPGRTESAKDYFQSLDDLTREKPWTKKDYPQLAQWVEANDKHIDRFVEASKRPRIYTPLISSPEAGETLISIILPVAQSSREAARALVGRAMYRVGNGDFEGALSDLMACHRLARRAAEGFTLVEALVGIAMDQTAMEAEAALITGDKLNAKQRTALRAELENLPRMSSMADKLDQGERLMYMDSVCWLAREGASKIKDLASLSTAPAGAADGIANLIGGALFDWDVPLRIGNKWYDRFVAAARIEDPVKRVEAINAIENDLKTLVAGVRDTSPSAWAALIFSPRASMSKKVGDAMVSLLLPALEAALAAEHRNQTKHTVLLLSLALAEYRDEHKTFPEKLDELAPKYVKTIPLDPMWGVPFVYLKTENGYRLYGLGKNGRDDTGRTHNDFDDADDLAIIVPPEKAGK